MVAVILFICFYFCANIRIKNNKRQFFRKKKEVQYCTSLQIE
ncbi:hypothetical protein HMPREF1551_02683 [Capnocytophaga sp. oral taxon 863 str. F0517]|nr:hypothetical protein HMPREF1551_02683 [Capnocytophaga sp. oral taxon 863 str. F0517]